MIPAKPRRALPLSLHRGGASSLHLLPNVTARRVPLESLRPEQAITFFVETFAFHAPQRGNVPLRHIGKAIGHTIGGFDLSVGNPDFAPPPSPTESATKSAGSPQTQPPPNDLLRRLSAILQPPLASVLAPNGVLEWPAPLLPYQRDGVAALLTRRELLLADDMGLGKTIQVIAALRLLFYRREIRNALIVCPASLMRQWRNELSRWSPELTVIALAANAGERRRLWRLPAPIKLVSYETLRGDVLDIRDSVVTQSVWDVTALDEASRIKNRESGISLACKRLKRERCWAMTGTPLENRADDVVSLLEFLRGRPDRRPSLPQTDAAIKNELRALQLRRKKGDVLQELPPKQVNELLVELPAQQRARYDAAEREGVLALTRTGPTITITHVLELISRLKQLCNFDPVTGASAKTEDIARRMQTLTDEGHRALIFSQFTDATFGVERLARALAEYDPLTYTGAMSQGQKAETIDRFLAQPRHKALILSLRAGGVGLNLQAASYVFHLDRWWNPAIEEQADSRAHRMGQVYPVTVYRYICADTIEERIQQKLAEKRRLFAEIVDDVTLDLSAALTEAELFALFGLPVLRGGKNAD